MDAYRIWMSLQARQVFFLEREAVSRLCKMHRGGYWNAYLHSIIPFWRPDIRISFALMIPMLIDGFTQKLTSYESTNFRRFVTGFLFGIGLVGIIADMTISCFYSGVEYGKALRNRR